MREAYRTPDGKIGYRCASEPDEDYIEKGGDPAELSGRKCLCNGLMATAGMPQLRKGVIEPPIITSGDDVVNLGRFLPEGKDSYTAADVIAKLLA